MKKGNAVFTIEEIKKKMERYCVYQERCHKEIEKKLIEYKVVPEAREYILLHLLQEDFLNEERFSKAFASGKFRIKKWGKQRITRELKFRDISAYNIKSALKEIQEEEYIKTFNELALKRLSQIRETNIYKKKKKLADYLLYRGWESSLVYEKVNEFLLKK